MAGTRAPRAHRHARMDGREPRPRRICASSTPGGGRTAPRAALHATGHVPNAVYIDWRADVVDTPEGGDALLLAAPDRFGGGR